MSDEDKSFLGSRTDYDKGRLSREMVYQDPIEMFKEWMKDAKEAGVEEPNAVVLSTYDGKFPHSRVVLLREIIEGNFIFYTNYNSKKGQDIAFNPHISINFFWPPSQRQVRIQGIAKKVDKEVSDTYFATRPRESQIGAWASPQSEELEDRIQLEQKVKELEESFKGKEVTRPDFWGGYKIEVVEIEFWQGRSNRLHDRIFYKKNSDTNNWDIVRLAP